MGLRLRKAAWAGKMLIKQSPVETEEYAVHYLGKNRKMKSRTLVTTNFKEREHRGY